MGRLIDTRDATPTEVENWRVHVNMLYQGTGYYTRPTPKYPNGRHPTQAEFNEWLKKDRSLRRAIRRIFGDR